MKAQYNPSYYDVIVLGNKHRIKMLEYETYERLIDRALAAAGYHYQDYPGWELTTAEGVVLKTDLPLDFPQCQYWPCYLNPIAGINA